ncbi:hypothetical protein M0R45_020742 [Rubus argutus]|uniref:F-box associated beta-propeller type 1 domain-containing protein n=1 Tax=Rubus argutus TaxID=59490 RepID=A0AAW1X998_RUBAR
MGILIQTYPHRNTWKSRTLDFTQIVECAGPDLQTERMTFRPKISVPLIGDRTVWPKKYGLINSCNGLLYLSGPKVTKALYVCNPILGEFITPPPLVNGVLLGSFVGLGFSAATNEYKVLNTCQARQAQIYTIGTGVWRGIGRAPYGVVRSPFNASLHGALHWATEGDSGDEFMHSFNFETEQFGTIPPPSHFAPILQHRGRLTLGVLGGCLLLCAVDDYSSKFDMWVMKDYGVQQSWTRFLVVENLYPRGYRYEPIMFLNNGEILMSCCGVGAVVCYNPETKGFRKTSIAPIDSEFVATGYSPSFVSLYDIAKGEEVERVRDNENFSKLFGEGTSGSAASEMPPQKCTNVNPGYIQPAAEKDFPTPSAITSSSHEQVDFTLRIGTECAICGAQLGYVFRGKGFAMCLQCFDSSSS